MKFVFGLFSAFLALSAGSRAQEFEISRLPHDISLEELANFSPEGIGEEVRVGARVELNGDILLLSNGLEEVRVNVSRTTDEVLECVSEHPLELGEVSLYFSARNEGAVITLYSALDPQNPNAALDFSDILCADIVANNILARNAAELGRDP